MALSAFGDELSAFGDTLESTPPSQPVQAATTAPQTSAFGDPISAFGDPLEADTQPAAPTGGMAEVLAAAQPQPQPAPTSSSIDPWQAYYGMARSVDLMGLAGGRIVGIPTAQTYDFIKSHITGEPTTEAQDLLNQHVLILLQARADSLAPKANDSLPNKLLNAAGGFGGNLAAMAATGGLSRAPQLAEMLAPTATEALPGVLSQVGQAGRAMAVPAVTDAVNTGHDVYAQTGDLPDALKAAAVTGAANIGMGLLPASLPGNLAIRLATGAPVGALTGEGTRQLRNMALPETMQQPFSAQDAIVNGLTGSVLAGALGRAPERSGIAPQSEPMQQQSQQQQGMPQPVVAPQGLHAQVMDVMQGNQQALTPKPAPIPTPFAGSHDINPLLDNLNLQGERRAQSLALLKPSEADIEARRRGVVSLDEQRRLAGLIGLEGAKAQVFSRKIGQAWSAEQMIAATDLVSDRLQSVLAQQKHIASGQATDLERADFIDSYTEMQSIFSELMGARAESGRALAAQRRKVQDVSQAKAILEKIGGVQNADDLAMALGEAVRTGGVANASKLMAKGPGFLHKWLGTYWRSALLTGMGTHAVNAVSNTGMLANEVVERYIASAIGAGKRAVGLKGETVFSEPMALLLGYVKNQTSALGAARQVWRTGESSSIDAKNTELYGDKAVQRPIELDDGTLTRPRQGKVDAAFDLPFRALGASDAYYRTLNFAAELEAQARQVAAGEKRAGTLPPDVKLSQRIEQLVATPTPAMLERADQHRAQQTFQAKGGPLLGLVMAAKARAPWLHAVAPFIQTPTNVVKEAMKRTPLAAAMPSVWSDFKAGGAKAERASARVVWGSSVMITAGLLAQAGYLTGNGPTDEKKKQALLATGWQPNSVRVGNDYYSYQRFSPLGIILSLSADLADSAGDDKKDAGGMVVDGLSSFSQNVTNQTFLKGISDFAQFASNPRRNGKWYASRMAGSFVQPFTLLSNAASTSDPYARETDGPLDSIMNRTPGLRTQLPIKRDAWGQPVPNAMNQYGPLSMAVPVAQSTQTTDPVLLEAARIGYSPGAAEPHFTLNKRRFELDAEQQVEFTELAGGLARKSLQRAMRTKGWATLGDDQKRTVMNAEMKKARVAVRLAFVPYLANGNRSAINKLRSAVSGDR